MSRGHDRAAHALFAAILVATGAFALAQSWQKWLDPIIDTGRDLYIPEQLRHGVVLYRDLRYVFPPLAPYLLAAITFFTGSSLAAYTAIGIVVAVATAALLYVMGKHEAGFAAALLFAACSLAGARTYGCTYIFPYAHAATFGMLFVLGAAACALARKPVPAVLLAIAAAWTKIDFIPVGAAILVAAWIARRLSWRAVIAYVAGLGLVAGCMSAIFGKALWTNIFPAALFHGQQSRAFYGNVTGVASWRDAIAPTLVSLVLLVAFVSALIALQRARSVWLRVALVVAMVVLSIPLAGNSFFRGWTVLQLVLIPFALRDREDSLVVMLALSLTSALRVFVNLTPDWYGFVFVVPLYLLIAYVVFDWLPRRGAYSRRLAAFWLLPVALVSIRWLHYERAVWTQKKYPIVTRRGTFYDINRDRAAILNAALPRLETAKSLVVIPEGAGINYFTGVPTNISVYLFTPPEIANDAVDASVAAELARRHPDRVVLVRRDLTEFGSPRFGADYARRITAFLRANYAIERRWDAPQFTLIVLRR